MAKWAAGPGDQALHMVCGKREGWGLGADPVFDSVPTNPLDPLIPEMGIRILGCPVILVF